MRSSKGLLWLAVGVTASMLLAFVLTVFSSDLAETEPGPGARSRSALGHHLLVAWLRRLDYDVHAIPVRTEDAVGPDDLLLVLEPDLSEAYHGDLEERDEEAERLREMVERAGATLLALPKRAARRDAEEKWRAGSVWRTPTWRAAAPLRALGLEGSVTEVDQESEKALGGFLDSSLANEPRIASPQLLTQTSLEPIVATVDGLLIGADPRRPSLWILADPDPLATHGLADSRNARFVAELIARLAPGRRIVIDESFHGSAPIESIWRQLLTPPLLFLTLQAALILAAAIWASWRRFGPTPTMLDRTPRGDTVLVDTTARLTESAGHLGFALERHFRYILLELAARHRVSEAGSDDDRLERLARVAERHGLEDPREIARAVGAARRAAPEHVFAMAKSLQSWRKDMTHGSRFRP